MAVTTTQAILFAFTIALSSCSIGLSAWLSAVGDSLYTWQFVLLAIGYGLGTLWTIGRLIYIKVLNEPRKRTIAVDIAILGLDIACFISGVISLLQLISEAATTKDYYRRYCGQFSAAFMDYILLMVAAFTICVDCIGWYDKNRKKGKKEGDVGAV